jgi:hypothetical protein
MRRGYIVLALMIAAAMSCLIVIAAFLPVPAHAEIHKEVGSMFCGSGDDIRAALHAYHVTMRGPSGGKSDKIAEIWTDKDGNHATALGFDDVEPA